MALPTPAKSCCMGRGGRRVTNCRLSMGVLRLNRSTRGFVSGTRRCEEAIPATLRWPPHAVPEPTSTQSPLVAGGPGQRRGIKKEARFIQHAPPQTKGKEQLPVVGDSLKIGERNNSDVSGSNKGGQRERACRC